MNSKQIRKIRITAYIGLFGSLAVSFVAILFYYISRHRFYMDNHSFRWLFIAGSVLAVVDITVILFALRRQIPKLRQLDGIDQKLRNYASLISNIYIGTCIVVLVLCVIIVFSYNNTLIMLLLLLVLMLFLSFPNMYKIKVDLGLDDEQMTSLFGNSYIPDPQPEVQEAEVVEEGDETSPTDENSPITNEDTPTDENSSVHPNPAIDEHSDSNETTKN